MINSTIYENKLYVDAVVGPFKKGDWTIAKEKGLSYSEWATQTYFNKLHHFTYFTKREKASLPIQCRLNVKAAETMPYAIVKQRFFSKNCNFFAN